jgi:hypothetical protein
MRLGFFIFIVLLSISCTRTSSKYEQIVEEVEKFNNPVGQLKKYKINNFSDLTTIRELSEDHFSDRGKGQGDIWVFKTNDNLVIFIETVDNGHAGEFGIVYSKNGNKPVWNHDDWGEFWIVGEKINDNWYEISFRLG